MAALPTPERAAACRRKEMKMATRAHRKPHGVDTDADDPEPGALPVEPDEGLVEPHIPEDPEHDRMVDPEA
jgi:hypothetical protein